MLSENTLVIENNTAADRSAAAHARAALESMYSGRCDISRVSQHRDPRTGVLSLSLETEQENIPCRLSYSKLSAATNTETAATVTQRAKIFTAPEIKVRCGSVITVTQDGHTVRYAMSGPPAVYPTHQELIVELYSGYAGEGAA